MKLWIVMVGVLRNIIEHLNHLQLLLHVYLFMVPCRWRFLFHQIDAGLLSVCDLFLSVECD